MSEVTEIQKESFRLLYSLYYYEEDINTVAGRILATILPHVEDLIKLNDVAGHALARELMKDIDEKPVSEDSLRESFPDYCHLIGVEWVED